jgi:hypothetical protein
LWALQEIQDGGHVDFQSGTTFEPAVRFWFSLGFLDHCSAGNPEMLKSENGSHLGFS